MFLGSTAGEGGEVVVIAVVIEVVIVVGTGTAPIEHAAGKHPTIHFILQVKRRLQRSRAWILITKLGTLTRTVRARPFVSYASAVLCPCVHFGNLCDLRIDVCYALYLVFSLCIIFIHTLLALQCNYR
jgi:hypothetical protein